MSGITPVTNLCASNVIESKDGPLGSLKDFAAKDEGGASFSTLRPRSASFFEPDPSGASKLCAAKTIGFAKVFFEIGAILKQLQVLVFECSRKKKTEGLSDFCLILESLKDIDMSSFRSHVLVDLTANLALSKDIELDSLHELLTSDLKTMPLKNLREIALKAKFFRCVLEKGLISQDVIIEAPTVAYSLALDISFEEADYELFSALFADLEQQKAISFLEVTLERLFAKKETPDLFFNVINHVAQSLGKHYNLWGFQKAVNGWLEKAMYY